MTTPGKRRNSPMAPYFVQLREFERRLLREAIEAGGDVSTAARMLGVTTHYAKARAKFLGGVGNEPKHEPPGSSSAAWGATIASSSDRRRARAKAAAAAADDAPQNLPPDELAESASSEPE